MTKPSARPISAGRSRVLNTIVRVAMRAGPSAADGTKTRTSLMRRASSRQVTITDDAAPIAAASAPISASVGSAATSRTTVVAPAGKVWTQATAASFITATLSGAVVTAMSSTIGAVTVGPSARTRKRPSHRHDRDSKLYLLPKNLYRLFGAPSVAGAGGFFRTPSAACRHSRGFSEACQRRRRPKRAVPPSAPEDGAPSSIHRPTIATTQLGNGSETNSPSGIWEP